MWPTKITCHTADMWAQRFQPDGIYDYRERDGLRTCGYCGSLHPEDLLNALQQPTTRLGGSDWKYGWPHKFYVDIVNPKADEVVEVGSRTENRVTTPIMGRKPRLHFKWYNVHLLDQGYSVEKMDELLAALTKHSGIEFFRDEAGKLAYRAPHHGYQRY